MEFSFLTLTDFLPLILHSERLFPRAEEHSSSARTMSRCKKPRRWLDGLTVSNKRTLTLTPSSISIQTTRPGWAVPRLGGHNAFQRALRLCAFSNCDFENRTALKSRNYGYEPCEQLRLTADNGRFPRLPYGCRSRCCHFSSVPRSTTPRLSLGLANRECLSHKD